MLEWIKGFLTRIVGKNATGDQDEPIVTALSKIKPVHLASISVGVRMRNNLTTYSETLVQLNEWLINANNIIRQQGYVDSSWKTLPNKLTIRNFDDYLLDDGAQYNLEQFYIAFSKNAVEFIDLCTSAEESTNLGQYYYRFYAPIYHDIQSVLKKIQSLI